MKINIFNNLIIMADITEKDLENIKMHKYAHTGYTTLDKKMNPFWEKCASFLPKTYTPNMVTVTGLFCQILSIIVISCFDLTFSKQLPSIIYIFSAFMLFMAQTLDAIDGKHARNTKRSSSLGQLMDHGCDSMDNFLFCIVICQAFLFGNSIQTLLVQIFIQIPFYAYTLEENFTKKLRTQINDIGVTEYQFFSMGLLIVSAIFGKSLINLEINGIRLSFIILYIVFASSILFTFYLIIIDSKELNIPIKKFSPLLAMIVFAIAELFSYKLEFYHSKPLLMVLLNGMYFSLFTCRLIIANMADKVAGIFDIDIFIYVVGISTCLIVGSKIIEMYVLIGLLIYLVYRYFRQIIYAIFKMMKFLNIGF
jgi:phosphatidylglycerophosphate synthase